METYVYIDGWNLYYGCVKNSPYRWLDLCALSRLLLKRGYSIERVKYFTAMANRPDDPGRALRQNAYIRALRTLPDLEVVMGRFVTRPKQVRLAKVRRGSPKFVDALITEEKGTDVKVATHLVWDACHGMMEAALVISNDSDLQESIDMAMRRGVHVITCNPHDHRNQAVKLRGDETRNIRKRHLAKAQLPREVRTSDGKTVTRPTLWDP